MMFPLRFRPSIKGKTTQVAVGANIAKFETTFKTEGNKEAFWS